MAIKGYKVNLICSVDNSIISIPCYKMDRINKDVLIGQGGNAIISGSGFDWKSFFTKYKTYLETNSYLILKIPTDNSKYIKVEYRNINYQNVSIVHELTFNAFKKDGFLYASMGNMYIESDNLNMASDPYYNFYMNSRDYQWGFEEYNGELKFHYFFGTYLKELATYPYYAVVNGIQPSANGSEVTFTTGTITRKAYKYIAPLYWHNSVTDDLANLFNSYIPEKEYGFPGKPTEEEGGNGSFDNTTDIIDTPDLPTDDITTSNFISMYKLTASQLSNLATYLWTSDFYENVKKMFSNPMDCIISLNRYYFDINNGIETTVTLGGINTSVTGNRLTQRFFTLDCGTIEISEYFGSALDYSPYTETDLYLPYIGNVKICTDDIMGKTINIKYNIDILTGSCVAYVIADNSVLYTFNGVCSQNNPISAVNYSQVISGILGTVGSIGAGVASTATFGASPVAGLNAVNSALNSKIIYEKGGSISANSGVLAPKKPFITLTIPISALPDNFNMFKGFVSNVNYKLSELSGYTEVKYINLNGINCTDIEKSELKELLTEGVIL